MIHPVLKESSVEKVGHFQASKWMHLQMLVDEKELTSIFDEIGSVYLIQMAHVVEKGKYAISFKDFLKKYAEYIQDLKQGRSPDFEEYQLWFCCAVTKTLESLFVVPAGPNLELVRIRQPVIQMKPFHFKFDESERKLRPFTVGPDVYSWGLEFSYPQLVMDPKTKKIQKTHEMNDYPNTNLFKSIQKWMRKNTVPTSFVIKGEEFRVPVRLGKECFSWIDQHPHLKREKIQVKKIDESS